MPLIDHLVCPVDMSESTRPLQEVRAELARLVRTRAHHPSQSGSDEVPVVYG